MNMKVPMGYIYVNERWKGRNLLSILSRTVQVRICPDMGVIDFYPCSDVAAIYITEAALLSGNDYKKNIVKLRKVGCSRNLVIVEVTHVSEQYYFSLQKFAVLELGLESLPVKDQEDCAKLLTFFVRHVSKENANPFTTKSRMPPLQTCITNSLCNIPSLGQVKAQALMENFASLHALSRASVEDLAKIVGHKAAMKVYEFFHT